MPASRDDTDLVKVARMYFSDGLSQQEVASALGISRSNVSRMLTAARERGIVQIRIFDPAGRDGELEEQIARRFGLSEVRIAAFQPGLDTLDQVGRLAADWLLDNARPGQTLAMSWGSALERMVRAVTTDRPHQLEIVQLVGGLSRTAHSATGQELVRELAARLGASYRYLHAPAVLDSIEAADALRGERSVREALKAARSAQVALVGVGSVGVGSSAYLLDSMKLSAAERRQFGVAAPVGDICARYYDINGQPVEGPVEQRVLGVSLEQLRRIPTVVGVVAGAAKAPGLLGALHGRLLDVLICDAAAARAIHPVSTAEGFLNRRSTS